MIDTIETKEKVKKFIIETAYVPEDKVQFDTLIFQDGIFDSMGFLSLINYIEDNFSIKADDAELLEENFESIDAIVSFINRKLN